MFKLRITFVDDKNSNKELQEFINELENKYLIINKSKIYKGRGDSLYSNIYLDVDNLNKVKNEY